MTIRTRLTLWYSSLLATVIVVFAISLFSLLSWTWRAQLMENMSGVADQIQSSVSYDSQTGQMNWKMPGSLSVMTMSQMLLQVWQADGQLIGASPDAKDYTHPFDTTAQDSTIDVWRDMSMPDGTPALVLTKPIIWRDKIIGSIQLVTSLATINQALVRLVRVMLGVGVIALLLSFIVGSVIAAQALQPIDVISNAARRITAANDLSLRIPYNGPPDELGQLTTTFNATLDRLERLFVAQRRFVADVSHELRTPLTTIQGNLDLIARYGNDPVSLEAVQSEVRRMTRLVGDLLMLAQADSGRLPLIEAPVEVDTLALDVFKQSQVLAKNVSLKLGVVEPVRVMGDVDRLKQLLLNLVTNAIKYTPAGGTVTISVTHEGGYAFVKVSDTGIGIPKEDLPHIFDRFYRVDKARARQMGGAGLGLSIAQWLAEAHKGRIWAESEPGKGSTFTVQIPSLSVIPDSMRETRPRMSILRRPRLDDR